MLELPTYTRQANIVAYHFSASIPSRVPTHSVLDPVLARSRRSLAGAGQAAERPGLFEFLRELAFEKSISVDPRFHGPCFRIGLAATSWQLQQSLNLLQDQSLSNPLSQPGLAGMTDANLDRVVALATNTSLNTRFTGALATIWLRRDGVGGLPQDESAQGRQFLSRMRDAGRHIVALEALAIDELAAPRKLVLEPMMRALQDIVVELWDSTDIVTSCPRTQVAYYCSKLGFSRVMKQVHKEQDTPTVLLHMPTRQLEPRSASALLSVRTLEVTPPLAEPDSRHPEALTA